MPHQSAERTQSISFFPDLEIRFARWAWAGLAVSLAALFVAFPAVGHYSHFSPDAWTMYELARTVGGDFFRATTAREYWSGSEYSSAFAPLWPVIISVFTRITNNIYATYIAAFLFYVGFAVAAELFGRRAFGQRGIGTLSALLLLCFPGLREELSSGRTIPLYLCELATIGALLPSLKSAPPTRSAIVGLLAGALAMTRFAELPSALVLLAGAPFVGIRGTRLVLMVTGFALAVSPWMAYSLVHFHTPYATDNRAAMLALDPYAFVLDFHVRPQLTLFDAPTQWMWKVLRHAVTVVRALMLAVRESLFLPVLLVLALIGVRRGGQDGVPHAHVRELIYLGLITLAPMSGYIVTGYWDHRYFSGMIWLAEIAALAFVMSRARGPYRLGVIGMLAIATLLNVAMMRALLHTNPIAVVRRETSLAEVDSLAQCLRRDGATTSDAVLFASNDVGMRFKFGAVTGWRSLIMPTNWARLGRVERDAFLRTYRARYIVDSPVPPPVPIALGATELACSLPIRLLRVHA